MATKQTRPIYTDLDINLDIHPISKDIIRISNEEAIIRSVKNLLLTDYYERPFQYNIGSNIRKLLFENFTPTTQAMLKEAIEETIISFEPRCNIIDIVISPFEDNNAVNVTFTFSVLNREEPITLDFYLDRIR